VKGKKMRKDIMEARKRAIKRETDDDRSMAIYLSSQGMAGFVIDTLSPQQLMMFPEIMENAAREGIDRSAMGTTRSADAPCAQTPFTEDDIYKIQEDIDAVFIEMIKHKISILKEEHGWPDDSPHEQEVTWDSDVSYCKKQWGGWKLKEIKDKMDMLADFAMIDRDKLHLLFEDNVSDSVSWPDYDKFYVYSKGSKLSMKKYVAGFISNLMEDGFIEEMASEYGEPGYSKADDDNLVITANWNGMAMGMYDIIENNGFDMEWSDEWIKDYWNDKLYRTQPDSYGWEPAYFYDDGEIFGIEDNEELYISTMVNDPHRLLSANVDLEKYGFVDLEEMCRETGWYGTVEDPKDVFDRFDDKYNEMVVQTCSIGQFAINWKVWGRNADA
jgi:hypothetical protein